MPFQRLLCHRIPPTQLFLGAIIDTFLRGKALVWKRMLLSQRGFPAVPIVIASRRKPVRFTGVAQSREMPYPFSGQAPVICCPALLGRALGVPRKIFSASDRAEAAGLPRFPSGRLYLTAKVASLFVRTFSHGCFACPHRRTRRVRRRSASVTFRGAGACPSSPSPRRWTSCPWRGWPAPPASPPAAFTCGIINARKNPGVALKTALSAPNQRIIKRIPAVYPSL